MILLGLALAVLVGLCLGLLGGGGSILTVPIFVYLLGFDAKEAIAMSLAVVGAVSLFGAASHWRAGNINLRVAVIFGGVAMIGTYLGARLAIYFSGAAQLLLFAVVMLLAAFFMFRDRPPVPSGAVVLPEGAPVAQMPLGLIVLEGLGVGVLTGLVGVGGGFLIVPALVLLGKIPMKQAVGTSLLVIAMKSATGFLGYLGQVEVPWGFMSLFSAVAVVGILGGTYLVRFVSQAALKRAFAIFLVVMGSYILYQNRGVLLPHHTVRERRKPPHRGLRAVERRAASGCKGRAGGHGVSRGAAGYDYGKSGSMVFRTGVAVRIIANSSSSEQVSQSFGIGLILHLCVSDSNTSHPFSRPGVTRRGVDAGSTLYTCQTVPSGAVKVRSAMGAGPVASYVHKDRGAGRNMTLC